MDEKQRFTIKTLQLLHKENRKNFHFPLKILFLTTKQPFLKSTFVSFYYENVVTLILNKMH